MTTIRIHFGNSEGKTSYDFDSTKGEQFRGYPGGSAPDVFFLPHGDDKGFDIVLANGLCEDADPSKQRGRLEGEVAIETPVGSEFDHILVHPTPVSIGDGRGRVFRIGKPTAPGELPIPYRQEILRGFSPDQKDVFDFLHKANFGDLSKLSPSNPDGAKEDRIIQAVWCGTLAYELGIRRDEVLAHSRAYVDRELEMRPCLYYDKTGTPVGLARNDIWIDEKGMRKGYHGKWARDAGDGGQLEDLEHLAPKRVYLAAAARDPVAKLYARFHAQAICTRPGVRDVKVQQQARAIGYQLEYLAHAAAAGVLDDLQARQCASNVIEGTHLSRGVGVGGIPYFGCWPVSTVHTTHVSLNEALPNGSDARLSLTDAKGYFEWRGIAWPFDEPDEKPTVAVVVAWLKMCEEQMSLAPGDLTTGPEGIQTLLNGVACWGVAIAARGMCAVARRWPDFNHKGLLEDAAEFLVERACTVGLDRDGKQIHAEMVFDSVAPRCWRVRQANVRNGGTTRWCVSGFMDLAETLDAVEFNSTDLQQRVKQLRAAARRIVEHAPDLSLNDKGVASIETAGLLALARFGD